MMSKKFLSSAQFYSELLKWWSDFREEFDTERDRQNIVWNNKEIRINNKPVFYKNFFESGIIYVSDLLFHLNNTDSFNNISQKISRTNVLIWAVNLWLCAPIIYVYHYYYFYCCFVLSLLGYYVIVSRHGVVVIINILNIKLPSIVLLVTL